MSFCVGRHHQQLPVIQSLYMVVLTGTRRNVCGSHGPADGQYRSTVLTKISRVDVEADIGVAVSNQSCGGIVTPCTWWHKRGGCNYMAMRQVGQDHRSTSPVYRCAPNARRPQRASPPGCDGCERLGGGSGPRSSITLLGCPSRHVVAGYCSFGGWRGGLPSFVRAQQKHRCHLHCWTAGGVGVRVFANSAHLVENWPRMKQATIQAIAPAKALSW